MRTGRLECDSVSIDLHCDAAGHLHSRLGPEPELELDLECECRKTISLSCI